MVCRGTHKRLARCASFFLQKPTEDAGLEVQTSSTSGARMDFARWLLLVGLAISLALSFLGWPIAPVLTGTFVAAAMIWVSVVAPRRLISKPASIITTLAASLGFGV